MKKIMVVVGGLVGALGLLSVFYFKPMHNLTDKIVVGITFLLAGGYIGGSFGYVIYGLTRGLVKARVFFAKMFSLQIANCFLFAVSISPILTIAGVLGLLVASPLITTNTHYIYISIFRLGTLPICVFGLLFVAICLTAVEGADPDLDYVSIKKRIEEIENDIHDNSPLYFYPRFFKGMKDVGEEMCKKLKESFA